jgi:hypothetical protein
MWVNIHRITGVAHCANVVWLDLEGSKACHNALMGGVLRHVVRSWTRFSLCMVTRHAALCFRMMPSSAHRRCATVLKYMALVRHDAA